MKKLTDKLNRDLSAQAMLLTASKVLTLLMSLVTGMLLSRFRTLTEYGTYSELLTVITLAVSIFTLGLPNCINYFLPKSQNQEEKDRFLSCYYLVITALSVVMGIALAVSAPLLERYYDNGDIGLYWYVLFILPWTKVIIGGRSNMLVATQRAGREIIHSLCNSICLLLIIVATKVLNQSFTFYLILYVVTEVLFTLAIYIETAKIAEKFYWSFSTRLLKKMLVFSIPMGLSTAVGTLNAELDKLMIGRFFDTETVAIYANAGKELPITYLSASFTAVILPQIVRHISEGRQKDAVRIWRNSTEFCFVVMNFFSMACIVFAPQIITVLYSEKYLAGVDIFRFYSLTLSLRITYWGMILNAYGRSKTILHASLAGLGANVVLNFLCFKLLGFVGPALATFFSVLIALAMQVWLTKKTAGIRILDMIPLQNIGKIFGINVLAAGVMALVVYFLRLGTSSRDIVICVALGAVWLAVYLALLGKRIRVLLRNVNGQDADL